MSDTGVKEVPQLKNQTPFQRFKRILGHGLAVALETNIREMDFKADELREKLGDKFDVKAEKSARLLTDEFATHQLISQPQIIAMSIRHSGASEGEDLLTDLILDMRSANPMTITFAALPLEYRQNPSKLNIRQRSDRIVLGLAFARFSITGISEENSPFYAIKDRGTFNGYINLDCLSNLEKWNPLYIKYHLLVADAFKSSEYGYLRVDVKEDSNRQIVISISRVPESEVPDILKTAQTLPR